MLPTVENQLVPTNALRQALANATTPVETKRVEELAKANKAYAIEQRNFEKAYEYSCVYIESRFATTELIKPSITRGGDHKSQLWDQGDYIVTLIDYGFTKKQWQRRCDELGAREFYESYQDDCVEKNIYPTPYGLVKYAKGEKGEDELRPVSYHISDDSYEWYTPPEYIEAARKVMGSIDLDPASSHQAQQIVKAESYFTKEDDGLAQFWTGNVWLNPPYNMPLVDQFTARAIDDYESGNITAAIILVNNSTDTAWFHRLLVYPVCFTKGRIQFINGAEKLATRQGQALFYLGDKPELFARVFTAFGAVMKRYDNQ